MMFSRITVLALAALLFLRINITCAGTTIYVDPGGDGSDGRSWATAWQTLSDAAADLAAVNSGVQGGHTVLVASATYSERLSLNSSHSGVSGARNVFIAPDRAKIDPAGAQAHCLHLNGAIHLEFEKFDFTGGSSYGVYLERDGTRTGHTIFRYCSIYGIAPSGGNVGSAVYIHTYRQYDEFHNCNIVLNAQHGVYLHDLGRASFYNCIFLGNGHYGINDRHRGEGLVVSNSVFYAQGRGAVHDSNNGMVDTEELLNSGMFRYEGGNNMIANPGFFNLSDWDFSVIYENSPVLSAATHGGHIGVFQPGEVTLEPVGGMTYYVDADTGDDGNSGMTPEDAWATAVYSGTIARAGDTVIVNNGVYIGQISVGAGAADGYPIIFRANGDVTLDGAGMGSAVNIAGVGGIVFDGFVIKGGDNAVRLSRGFACMFRNCAIREASSSGILINLGGAHEFTECEIAHNTGHGVEAENSGGVMIQRSLIHDNNRGVSLDGSSWSFRIHNSIIRDNRSDGVYHFTYNRDLQIENSVLFGNAGSGLRSYAAVAVVKNTIFANNGGRGAYNHYSSIGPISAINCLFYDNAVAEYESQSVDPKGVYNTAEQINSLSWNTNNIVADPLLRDPFNGDFRLNPGSPCVDAGTNDVVVTVDFYGRQRLVGTAVDIGAYEMPSTGMLFFSW